MRSELLRKWRNERGFIFPLTSFIVLLLFLLIFHQTKQYETQKQLTELNLEQYHLDMLYQKAYTAILKEETKPPYQFNFPDGTVHVTITAENGSLYLLEMKTTGGSYRELTIEIQK